MGEVRERSEYTKSPCSKVPSLERYRVSKACELQRSSKQRKKHEGPV